MATMEVKVISRETIKPSSPTPNHLRTHKLSLLDQIEIIESVYIPVILFYSVGHGDSGKVSNLLKQSLSKTLTHFYPFTGRVKDSFSIDCNDEGAIYIEAQVATDMDIVLKEPEIDLLLQLLPSDSLERLSDPTAQVLVVIQVNFFACGGMAICACVDHVVADGAAAATFVKTWAEIACGANYVDGDVIYDCTTVFHPQDLSGFWKQLANEGMINETPEPEGKVVTKRLLFDGSNIAALRNEIGNRPSRFEAVAALIWHAMLSTAAENDETFSRVTVSMNLRSRTNPPFPQQCIGNVYQVVESPMKKTMNLSSLAGKIHETITKVDDDYVRKLGAGGGYLGVIRSKVKNRRFLFSSWCRFPFNEADFGWGKPVWFGTALRINRAVIFLDSKDGEGIEAWITLTQEEMASFEQDPGILAYSFSRLSMGEFCIQNSELQGEQ